MWSICYSGSIALDRRFELVFSGLLALLTAGLGTSIKKRVPMSRSR
jgi:hypothetical protein